MRSEILIYLLIPFLSAAAQSIESENTMEADSSSSPSSPSSSFPMELEPNLESETLEQNFLIQKLIKTTTPPKTGFPLPEIKRARELGAPDYAILEQEPSLSTPPFIVEIDHNSTIEIQFNHRKYQNVTHEEKRNNYETSISGLIEVPQISSMIRSTSSDETDDITKMSKHIENEKDALPLEVRAADPFATTITEESTSSTSQENILHMIQKINSLTTADFVNNSNNIPSETGDVDQTGAFHGNLDTDAVDRIHSLTASSLKPEQETITTGTTDTTEMTLEIQKTLQETKVIIPEKQDTTAVFGTIILGTVPGIFSTTATDVVTVIEQTTEMPMFHPVVSYTFSADSDEKVTTTNQSEIVIDETTAVDISWKPGTHLTESESATTSVEIEHKSEQPEISTTSVELPPTTKEFNIIKNHENEQEQDDEHVHDDENIFVGDKTLFNQDRIMKQDFSVIHSVSRFVTSTKTSEENFGVPGFSRVEGLGPEATEEIHQTEADTTIRPSALKSLNTEFKIRTGIPTDLVKHSREHHNVKGSQTSAKTLKENDEPKDISVIDDSFYVHADNEEAASTLKTIIDKRKLEPKPTSGPESVPFPENGILKSSKASPEPVIGFESKVEQEITTKFGDSKGNNDDSNDMSHNHHHITDSDIDKEGAYKVPFSFHITSIDYIPEFSDPSSGKYKKLRDQLLPDLEEIFGSIFGHAYGGIRLVNFLKGSVAVDGIVYTSTKPDDMEQSATEFEQQITAKNSQIGGNDVDPRSILLDGYVSKNYVERIHEGYTSTNTSSYIVGGGIAVAVLAILLIAFIIIAMNNRRTNGTLKLKEENIAMAESSRSMWPDGTSPVNLMAYGNGRTIHGRTTTDTQPPMVMIGSQMTAVNMHAADRAIQPRV